MGNEWWGTPDAGDDDGWQQNWDNKLSSKEHNRAKKQGSEEDIGRVEKQGSEEDKGNDGLSEDEKKGIYVPKNEISDRFYPR